MINDMTIALSHARQDEIARNAGRRRSEGGSNLGRWLKARRERRALHGGGMLPLWRHGSAAHGS